MERTPVPSIPSAPAVPAGGLLFQWRSLLGVGIALFLVFFPWGRLKLEPWQLAVGGGLVLAGVALRLWCIRQIGGSARKTSRLKAVRVISCGPYAMVRNPIYIANTTVFAGFTVLSGLLGALPVILLLLGFWYNAIVRREEEFLARSFPADFSQYSLLVRRWIPRLRYEARPEDVPRYPFLRAIKRERGHIIAVATGVSLVVLRRILYS